MLGVTPKMLQNAFQKVFHVGAPLFTFWAWFQMITLKVSKTWSKKDKELIFFSVKAEITHFLNLTSGGPRGDLEKFYFGLKLFRKKSIFFSNGTPKVKYRSYKSPRGPPDVRFRKCVISAFTEKKIILIALLDHFLQKF